MKKNKLLIIIAALAVIALIIIIVLAIKEKRGTSPEEVNTTETPTPTQELLLPTKSEPMDIKDVKYPFTLIPKDDGTLEMKFVSEAPDGFSWQPAENYIADYLKVEQLDGRSYRFTGLLTASTSVDIPLKKNDKYGLTACVITIDVSVGAENSYEKVGEIVDSIEGEKVVIPLLKTNGDETTGVSVVSYSEKLYDISDSVDGIIYNDVEEYAEYHIDVSENESNFRIGIKTKADDWKVNVSGDSDVNYSDVKMVDGEAVFSLKVNPESDKDDEADKDNTEADINAEEDTNTEADINAETDVKTEADISAEADASSEDNEDSSEKERNNRRIYVNLYSVKDNVSLQINIASDEEGKSEIIYHYAMILDYGM